MGITMLRNYLTVALRVTRRNAGYAFLNVGGLALGLATCLVIGLFIRFKLSYDRHFETSDRVFRLIARNPEVEGESNAVPTGLATTLMETFPEIEAQAVLAFPRERLLYDGDRHFELEHVFETTESLLDVFPMRVLRGDARRALSEPGNLVLTESQARRLFGADDPLGRTVDLDHRDEAVVAAVVADLPPATHFRFDALLSMSQRRRENFATVKWGTFSFAYYYLLLRDRSDPGALVAKMTRFVEEADKPAWLQPNLPALQPLTDIHLHSQIENDIAAQSDVRYLYLFGAVGVLILLVAAVNYTNLATARATRRAREVGMRKAIGAARGQITGQFLGESVLTALAALVPAFVLTRLAVTWIDRLAGQTIPPALLDWRAIGVTIVAVTIVGILAGIYPSLVLSRFGTIDVLKGRVAGRPGRGASLRHVLVSFQFVVSLVLLVATVIVFRQLRFVQGERLGFDKERLIYLPARVEPFEPFRQELLRLPQVAKVSFGVVPGVQTIDWMYGYRPDGADEPLYVAVTSVYYGSFETLGLPLVRGRDFSPALPADTVSNVILNEEAVRVFGLEDDPIGRQIPLRVRRGGPDGPTVVGVVRDFRPDTFRDAILPMVFIRDPGTTHQPLIRLGPGDPAAALAAIGAIWDRMGPDRPFDYGFVDDALARMYLAEQRFGRIFGVFSSIAILIACLGLLGLAAYAAESRRKEIGIRKVLGATAGGIVALLSKDFALVAVLSTVIAAPIAWLAMDRWLQDFAYHIDVGPGLFASAAVALAAITFASVGFQSLRAARAHPADELRHE